MAGSVSVVLVVEAAGEPDDCSDLFLSELTRELATAQLEVTLIINGDRARFWRHQASPNFLAAVKQMNIGLAVGNPLSHLAEIGGEEGARLFRHNEHPGFLDVSRIGGHIPSSLVLPAWAPQPMEVIADWGTRTILVPHGLVESDSRPYFLAGRLHLASLGPYWMEVSFQSLVDEEGRRGLLGQVTRRAEQLLSTGGVVVLRLAANQTSAALEANHRSAALGYRQLAETLRSLDGIKVDSVRQAVDRWSDISYDLALPTEFFREESRKQTVGELGPIRFEVGYLSPAEQLAALSRIWLESIQKGKAVRNTTLRSPLGPRQGSITDLASSVIPAGELEGVLQAVVQGVDNQNRLPSFVSVAGGRLSVQDLLASICSSFSDADLSQPIEVPVRQGKLPMARVHRSRWNDSLMPLGINSAKTDAVFAEAEQQVWSLKPALFD
jgi:hypothetical protein